MALIFNYTQTPLPEDILTLGRDLSIDLIEHLDQVKFISNLISPYRRKSKDMPKDEDGKIIVDFTNPHILENMDFFRKPALHYQQFSTYTDIPINKIPGSEYEIYWVEEARRCRDGLIRKEDGEWISGYYYWYLNYSPIIKNEILKGKKAVRTRDFPDVYDGDYLFFHYVEKARVEGSHCAVLKKRGSGNSFKASSMAGRNFVLGEKSFTSRFKSPCITHVLANEKEYLTKDGLLNKFVQNIDWVSDNTPWPSIRDLKDAPNDMAWKMGYKDSDTGTEVGSGNEVLGTSLKNDPQKARGKRGLLIIWEESGKFTGLLQAWNIARESVEEGSYTFGTMLSFGTGGVEGADFTALKEMFYNPKGYNIQPLQNVFDKNVNEDSICSFFFAGYLNRKGCYDKNGNSDVVKSLIEILSDRIHVKKYSSDPSTLTQRKAEMPITPQEAIMVRTGSIFPSYDIREYLAEIIPNMERFVRPHFVGRLNLTSDGKVEFKEDPTIQPIRDFPIKDDSNKEGAIEIFEKPLLNKEGKTLRLRYIAGIDTVDDDASTTSSLPSIIIFDRYTNRIVAEYTGRPRTATEFYEVCRRLLLYYGATANYENDKKGLYTYFSNHGALHLLCTNLEILEQKGIAHTRGNYGNKKYGTNSGKEVNALGRRLQADWMIEPAVGTGGEDDEGNKLEVRLNLQIIRSIAYLKEAMMWNPDGNFDRVSAMGMLMLYREDLLRIDIGIKEDSINSKSRDIFFERMFKKNGDTTSLLTKGYSLFQ